MEDAKAKNEAKSSTESEILAVSDFMSQTIHLRNFIEELTGKKLTINVLQDNKSTITLLKHGGPLSEATRHIQIRNFFVKDYLDRGEVQLSYCPTNKMLADGFTKPLIGRKFYEFRHEVMNIAGRANRRGVLEYE